MEEKKPTTTTTPTTVAARPGPTERRPHPVGRPGHHHHPGAAGLAGLRSGPTAQHPATVPVNAPPHRLLNPTQDGASGIEIAGWRVAATKGRILNSTELEEYASLGSIDQD